MNYKFFSMKNTFLKKVAPMLAVFALTISVLNFGSYDPYNELTVLTPEVAQADLSVPNLNVNNLDINSLGGTSVSSSNYSYCTVTASANTGTVEFGSSVTLTWSTQNAATITINGEPQSSVSGSRTFHNIQANTTYTLVAKTADGNANCSTTVNIQCVPPVVVHPLCEMTPAEQTINSGSSANLTWSTTNTVSATLTSFGTVGLSGTQSTGPLSTTTSYTLTATAENGETVQCHSIIKVKPTTVKYCELTLEKSVSATTAKPGDELTYTIKIKNTGTADCTGGGVKIVDVHDDNLVYLSETHTSNLNAGYGGTPVYVLSTQTLSWNGNTLTPGEEGTIVWKGKVKDLACDTTTIIKNRAQATAYELSNFTTWVYSNIVETSAYKTCEVPVASCDAFTAAPTVIQKGQSSNLTWSTTNATRVVIDNGIGEVTPIASGTRSVSPLATTTYTLTAYGTGDQKHTCTATVTVKDIPVETLPKCEAFTATPTTTAVGGGTVNLAWATKDATSVSISPTIGSVATTGTTSVSISTTTTYTLTASNVDGEKDTCAVTIVVPPPTSNVITCADNVTISVADSVIRRGNSTTLNWSTTGITGVTFDNGITSTALSGSTTVTPSNTTTYTLTATDGTTSVACPVTVRVDSGGGGGSNAPRCELEISDTKIKLGESVVLTWDSTRATDLFIEDQTEDRKIVTTIGLTSSKKDDLFEGKITVKPKEDTRYLLTVKRGSSTRTCAVKVEVEDGVTFTQIRDQQPLVAGISLTEVPYTGFEAGPILTLLFYSLLMAWALYVAYLIVIRRDVFGGLTLATAKPTTTLSPEQIRSDVFVAKVQVPEMPVSTLPTNLPTGGAVVGYASAVAAETKVSTNVHNIDDAEMTAIENQAHAARVLLSSDAIRHFIATTNNVSERTDALNQVILAAKAQFPAEDGWIVLNEKRMQELCVVCAANAMHSSAAPYIPAVIPEGSGSLAEAIVGGNVLAAYELIGHRPMFALADAAADLDAVYRIRRGGNAVASELLMKSTASLTDAQVLAMIEALTGALDGTYNDEASAVKMSIMKAIKVVA